MSLVILLAVYPAIASWGVLMLLSLGLMPMVISVDQKLLS